MSCAFEQFVHELFECYVRGFPKHGIHALGGETGQGVDLIKPYPAAAVVIKEVNPGHPRDAHGSAGLDGLLWIVSTMSLGKGAGISVVLRPAVYLVS